ncbi:MAG: serine/threonine-protein phosphatase [Steroidobacteraceae bacterium]|nr:serine/threonine-protein phosphatase [Steroidobacteraceae bacterium]
MQIEYADVSDVGHREENQDRAAVAADDRAALLLVLDGMGGHSDGALAAEIGRKAVLEAFAAEPHPLFDPLGFLHLTLGRAHEAVAGAGRGLPLDQRPRATCAVCLVQQGAAYWAHLGDSRVYHLRNGAVLERTRDHSHVEQLLRDGQIREDEVHGHPLRNFVECCIGGEHGVPDMTLSRRRPLQPGDILLACSDGVWSNLRDAEIASFWSPDGPPLAEALSDLVDRAVQASAPHSDNATAAALRWLG